MKFTNVFVEQTKFRLSNNIESLISFTIIKYKTCNHHRPQNLSFSTLAAFCKRGILSLCTCNILERFQGQHYTALFSSLQLLLTQLVCHLDVRRTRKRFVPCGLGSTDELSLISLGPS
ncbi:hypothetical protein ACOME3_007968 [Neoechinorhynchus agilis]